MFRYLTNQGFQYRHQQENRTPCLNSHCPIEQFIAKKK
jgi:hypothetical protein